VTYEQFKNNPNDFICNILDFYGIDEVPKSEILSLAKKAEPIQKNKDIYKHKRSGESRQFEGELKKETIRSLNLKLDDVLNFWSFE